MNIFEEMVNNWCWTILEAILNIIEEMQNIIEEKLRKFWKDAEIYLEKRCILLNF